MLRVTDINGDSIVVDGGWVDKLRGNASRGRVPVADCSEVDALIAELERARGTAS